TRCSASFTSGSRSSGPMRFTSPCYLGLMGVPRRYFEMGEMAFVPQSATTLNIFITMAALLVCFAEMMFLFNLIWSLSKGKPAGSNPWRATTLEWQTPETPPGHGNWGKELPVVYRWAYDYSVPGAKEAAKPARGRTRRLGKRAVSITILFVLAPIGAIVAWWLSRQRLTAKPWLEVGAIDDFPRTGALSLPAATIGLGVFLAVVSSLFALFISAYFMRMQVADWAQMPAPKVLWFNTGVLILSSVALQYAQVAARRGRMEAVGDGLIAGGLFACTFLVGQLFAWQQLN